MNDLKRAIDDLRTAVVLRPVLDNYLELSATLAMDKKFQDAISGEQQM